MLFGLLSSSSEPATPAKRRRSTRKLTPAEFKRIQPVYYQILAALANAGAPCRRVEDPVDQLRYTLYRVTPIHGTQPDAVRKARDAIAVSLGISAADIVIDPVRNGYIPIQILKTGSAGTLVRFSERMIWPRAGIPIWFGLDQSGRAIYRDLAELPHLMIGGTTGGGKSNALRAILGALLRHGPDRLRLLLIDPKWRGLQHFDGVDSLLCPIVRGVSPEAIDQAETISNWTLAEINRRYESGTDSPAIVVVVDELIQMLNKSKRFGQDINDIAMLGRECGVYFIGATQSPKKEYLSAELMENLPSRLALRVTDRHAAESIGCKGAEQLFDKGDAFLLTGGRMHRVQLPFVDPAEDLPWILAPRQQVSPDYEPALVAPAPALEDTPVNAGFESLTEELKQCYDIAADYISRTGNRGMTNIKAAIRESRGSGIGDPKLKKLVNALKKDGVIEG
jgi:S-DNA-T family DNA segregation ATPase FtsK/SpoIIIE